MLATTEQKMNVNDINNKLTQNFFGWFFDYDEGYQSYFVSIYDPNNFKDELFFLVDFETESTDEIITSGLRFKASGKSLVMKTTHPTYKEAQNVASYIKGCMV